MEYSATNTTARNVRFGASGGVDSVYTEQAISSFALVRASPIPPPDAKPRGVARNCYGAAVFEKDK
jgi:hypothetical protein